ncbi:MAG TPA: dTDP-4-dehydrorhamnose reductase [Terriglobales bacterium]|nr:dTDP-4-dehydrorhamnose reductase [Terriglobales bacterium]
MRVTIFGGTGLLGKALVKGWTGDEVTALSSKDADIRDPQAVTDAVTRSRPDWIVLAAAYTDVDGCESRRDLAFDVNAVGAANVAGAAKQVGARLLFVSTDYVFDGRSSVPYQAFDERGPMSVYGASKATAEVALQQVLPQCCIARTSWLFGVGGKCFPDTILRLAATRPQIDVVDDQRGCPTYTIDLARAIMQLCRVNAEGIVHATNWGDCTWFEFASQIVKIAGLTTAVVPTITEKMKRPAPRPAYSVLSPDSLRKYQITMPSWQDALERYLSERELQATATQAVS